MLIFLRRELSIQLLIYFLTFSFYIGLPDLFSSPSLLTITEDYEDSAKIQRFDDISNDSSIPLCDNNSSSVQLLKITKSSSAISLAGRYQSMPSVHGISANENVEELPKFFKRVIQPDVMVSDVSYHILFKKMHSNQVKANSINI